MPFIRIMVHLIWSTKDKESIIVPCLKPTLLDHLKSNAKEKNIWIDTINCVSDHVHALISLGAEQSISKVGMLLKGESSHWINKNDLTKTKFEWQDEYIAISVSESNVETVKRYILNQEEHHRKKSFAEECDEFLKKYGEGIVLDRCG
ncbi:MAG: IS200/IS605 family transposase [Bacteroidota bacterium]